jgi:hydrogenase maturation protein HypF
VNVPIDGTSLRIEIQGLVQGVGFRPFVFRLAQAHDVKGWVQNTGEGVVIEARADAGRLQQFMIGLRSEKPVGARIDSLEIKSGEEQHAKNFAIRESRVSTVSTDLPLDVALCVECRRELSSKENRRFQYPFITCASCGPRFTILHALPFDRDNTSMAKFRLCPACAAEYSDPGSRRFHAQTISCPDCGPRLTLMGRGGLVMGMDQDAISQASSLLRDGGVLALKGVGGYHLAVDASNEVAIQGLRQKKKRPEKPLAVMFDGLKKLREFAQPTQAECEALLSPASPIVLVKPHGMRRLARGVGQRAPLLGAMLPHSPLHLLLCQAFDSPLVMTSANESGGPIITDDGQALQLLGSFVDAVLTHDRDIVHHADDSVVRLFDEGRVILRLGRGLAPCVLPWAGPSGILALGGHQKNSFALSHQKKIFISQDMGKLDDYQNLKRCESEIRSWLNLMKIQPACILHDQHPDYGSTRLALRMHQRTHGIQHHEAHVLASGMNQLENAGLALAWDGWGLGSDGTLWGGECFAVNLCGDDSGLRHMGSLLPFPIVGRDRAAREPWRSALGVAYTLFGERASDRLDYYGAGACCQERGALDTVLPFLGKGLASASCSSVGRIFDAVASFLGIKQVCTFEGQAAMLLEGQVDEDLAFDPYPVAIQRTEELYRIDWRPGITALLQDVMQGLAVSFIAARFHQMWVQAVMLMLEQTGHQQVFLSGGVFQNVYLQRCLRKELQKRNVSVHSPRGLPLHDGNLAAGQLQWALLQGIV